MRASSDWTIKRIAQATRRCRARMVHPSDGMAYPVLGMHTPRFRA
jgi:hypothetical protein